MMTVIGAGRRPGGVLVLEAPVGQPALDLA
jgi:hypothetical protein